MVETIYRRPLPPHAIAFASAEGRTIFSEALAEGGLDGYFPLAEQFHTQSDPAFCGLGSLVVALNALGIDPGRLWKGPWRWFAEDLLDCCVPLAEVRARGLSIEELACLARCNGADVDIERAASATPSAFRETLGRAARGESVLIVSYDRAALGQTGGGHFSPVGGYHAARGLALILDVARFKYPAHWLPVDALHQAMVGLDPSTGLSRGWLELRRRASGVALGFNISCAGESWLGLNRQLAGIVAAAGAGISLAELARRVVPLAAHVSLRVPQSAVHERALGDARAALKTMPAFGLVVGAVGEERAETVLILLLSLRDQLSPEQREALVTPADNERLAAELEGLRAQLAAVAAL